MAAILTMAATVAMVMGNVTGIGMVNMVTMRWALTRISRT